MSVSASQSAPVHRSRYVLRPVSLPETWNQFVSAHPRGHLLQSWQWGELKATSGWSPVRLALYDEDRIVAAAQVLRRTVPHVPLRVGHLAYIPKGPVIDWSNDALCTTFLGALHDYLKQQGALALDIEVGVETDDVECALIRERLKTLQAVR
ncbi:MAG TPA: hypothetical protein DHW02_13205, partial [Ktedonobacter sp.]|nr:hypothetical protein [Ktedonobacter sp.]